MPVQSAMAFDLGLVVELPVTSLQQVCMHNYVRLCENVPVYVHIEKMKLEWRHFMREKEEKSILTNL